MVSKMIVDRQRAAAKLGAVLDTHAEEASATFTHLLEPFAGEEAALPDLVRFQRLLQRRLEALAGQMVSADEVHVSEQEEDQISREERDAAFAELRPLVSRFRALLELGCGPGTCARLFSMTGSTPRDPLVLARVARRMVNRLSAETFILPKLVTSGVQIDVAAWVADLEPPLERLEASLGRLFREDRESVDTRLAKGEAMAEYDRAYLSTARILEEMFRYAGLAEKAETLRPSRRSGSGSEEPQDAPPDADPPFLSLAEAPDLFPEVGALTGPAAGAGSAPSGSEAPAPMPAFPPVPHPPLVS